MKEWRVITVLLAIIVLLSVILGIKIINNTPEKQIQEVIEQSSKKNESISIESEEEKISINQLDSYEVLMFGVAGVLLLIISLMTISGYKLCFKLEINSALIWSNIALNFITGAVTSLNLILGLILIIVNAIILIIIIVKAYKTIGGNPLLLLLGLIPFVGSICMILISIDSICKLANYFNKGIGFKLGLIFLPFIFMPILAFSGDE